MNGRRIPPPSVFLVILEDACTLEIALEGTVPRGREAEAIVYLEPGRVQPVAGRPSRPATPWSLLSPRRVVGGSLRIEGLPACELDVLAFLPGARGRARHVDLVPGRVTRVAVEMRPTGASQGGVAWDLAPAGAPGRQDPLRALVSSGVLGRIPALQPLTWLPGLSAREPGSPGEP